VAQLPCGKRKLRPKPQSSWWVIFLLVIGVALSGPHAVISAGIHAAEIVRETNVARQTSDLLPLQYSASLAEAAQQRADELALAGAFTHSRPDGRPFHTALQDADYAYASAGENLAVGYVNDEDVISGWLASPTHKKNLLGPYTEIGIGVAVIDIEGSTGLIVVQLLATQPHPEERGWIRVSVNHNLG
jgi:hypothetical protein